MHAFATPQQRCVCFVVVLAAVLLARTAVVVAAGETGETSVCPKPSTMQQSSTHSPSFVEGKGAGGCPQAHTTPMADRHPSGVVMVVVVESFCLLPACVSCCALGKCHGIGKKGRPLLGQESVNRLGCRRGGKPEPSK